MTQALPTLSGPDLPALLTPREVAATLRVDVSTVYRAVRADDLRAVRLSMKLGGAIRIPAAEVERVLAGGTTEEAP